MFDRPSEQNIVGGSRKFRGMPLAEALTKTPNVGSESRGHSGVSEENLSSKDEVQQERGENAEPYLSKYEQERSQVCQGQ